MNWKKRYRRLEDRVLLDAAGAVTVADSADTADSQDSTDAQAESRAEHLQEQEELTNLIAALGESQEQADQAASAEAGPEILFVDSQVDDIDQLLENLDDNIEVYFIDPDDDGAALIADVLENSDQTYSAIHIVSHGNAGELRLGTTTLTSQNLVGETLSHVQAWGNSLTETGDILIYGCSVAEGEAGTAFVQQLADITGADIAASIDDTGAAALGGDWDLEVSAGQVETELAIPESTQVSWNNLLVTVTDRGSLGGDVGDDAAANQALVDQLAPPGSGVDIGSVVFDNTVYDDNAIGTFTDLNDPSGNVLLERGVVISTGFVDSLDDAPGGIMGDDLNSPGVAGEADDEPDLNASWLADSGQELDQFDITVFEFTFTPNTDVNKVALNYVFATEEDQGFAFGNYPDLFGIYIRNDTAGGTFQEFVFSNLRELHTDPDGGGPLSAPLQSNATGDFESNFVTGVQNAVLDLGNPAPGTQFTIKFALADHSDTNYDSAAFFDWLGSALRLDIDADDSNASGIDYATQFDVSTGSAPANIVDVGDVSLQNFDPTTTVQTATIRLTNATGSDALAIDTIGLANIDSTNIDTSVPGEVTLTIDFDDSATSTADVVAALEAITYANGDGLAIDQTDREVTIVLSDGETNSSLATTTIDVVGVMTQPTVASQTATTLEPVITGTFDDVFSDTLVVVVDGQTFTGSSLRGSPSFTPGLSVAGNSWTLDLSSPSNPISADGTYDVQVTTTNAAGNVLDATSGELFIDSTGPAEPVVNPLTTNNDLPTITGTYDNTDGTVTEVVVNGVTYLATGPDLTVNLDGTWSLTIPVGNELPDGTYDVAVTAEDALSNSTTDTVSGELVIDTTGPSGLIVDSLTTTSTTPTITGSFDETDGTVTQVEVNGIIYPASGPALTVDGVTGNWSLTIPPPDALPDGTYDVVVTAEDALGNTSTDATSGELIIDNTPPAQPAVNPLTTTSSLPTITGTYDNSDGTVSQVVVNGITYLATGSDLTVNPGGTWTLTIPVGNELPEGSYDVAVTAVDGVGNVSVDATTGELVVDNTGPAAPTVTALATSQSNPTISGTYDETDGTVTQVVIDGVTYLASGPDLTVNANGTWSLLIPAGNDLVAGTYDVEITAEDPLGNATVVTSVG
nr:DUF4347 domain-containing protein [Halieaceae bacterium]